MKIPRRIPWGFDPNTSDLEALKNPQDRTLWAVLRFGHIVDQNFNATVADLGHNLRLNPPADGQAMFSRAWNFDLNGFGVTSAGGPFTADLEWWNELFEAWRGNIVIEHVLPALEAPK